MKIMIISSYLPYPLINGGNIRLYNLLKRLSKKHEITLICEKRSFQTDKDIDEVKKFCKKILTVPRKKQWSLGNILRSAFSLDSFLVIGHTLPEMKKKIKEELEREKYDLIHVETFYVMQNLPKTLLPVVLVEHNVEYLVYRKFVDHSPFFVRPFLNWDVIKLKNKEKEFWKKAKSLVAVSEKEQKTMNASFIVPNGVDTEKFKPKGIQNDGKRILFIGDFKWLENRDSIRWILKEIWPEISSKIPELKLWVVGKNITDGIKKLDAHNVIFDENAPSDTSVIYNRSFALLAPIRIGGGTSFKILEAMASGVPVVTTSLGAEGITKGREIVRADSIDQTVKEVSRLFSDSKYYETISKSAKKLAEEKYDWRKISEDLERVYEETVKEND